LIILKLYAAHKYIYLDSRFQVDIKYKKNRHIRPSFDYCKSDMCMNDYVEYCHDEDNIVYECYPDDEDPPKFWCVYGKNEFKIACKSNDYIELIGNKLLIYNYTYTESKLYDIQLEQK